MTIESSSRLEAAVGMILTDFANDHDLVRWATGVVDIQGGTLEHDIAIDVGEALLAWLDAGAEGLSLDHRRTVLWDLGARHWSQGAELAEDDEDREFHRTRACELYARCLDDLRSGDRADEPWAEPNGGERDLTGDFLDDYQTLLREVAGDDPSQAVERELQAIDELRGKLGLHEVGRQAAATRPRPVPRPIRAPSAGEPGDGQLFNNYARLCLDEAAVDGLDFTGADLSGMWFHESDFSGVILRDASCGESIFKNCVLDRADLSNADLRGADLRGTSFVGATLRGADLRGAALFASDLLEADVAGVTLDEAELGEFVPRLVAASKQGSAPI